MHVEQHLSLLLCEKWPIFSLQNVVLLLPLAQIGSRFVKRRAELHTRYSRRYGYQHAQNEDPKALHRWFGTVQHVITENGILPEDIYNFDETGFAMSQIFTAKVVTHAEYYGRRVVYSVEITSG